MYLFVDETECPEYFIVTGLLVNSKEDVELPRGSRNDVIKQQVRLWEKIIFFSPSEGRNQRKVRMWVKVKHFYFLCNRHLVQKMLTARMRCWMTYEEILLYRIKHPLGNRICQGERFEP